MHALLRSVMLRHGEIPARVKANFSNKFGTSQDAAARAGLHHGRHDRRRPKCRDARGIEALRAAALRVRQGRSRHDRVLAGGPLEQIPARSSFGGNLRLVERFRCFGADELRYEFVVDDSTVFVSTWSGALTMSSLAQVDPRRAQVVELRYFGGQSVEETADVLSVSPRTPVGRRIYAREPRIAVLGKPSGRQPRRTATFQPPSEAEARQAAMTDPRGATEGVPYAHTRPHQNVPANRVCRCPAVRRHMEHEPGQK